MSIEKRIGVALGAVTAVGILAGVLQAFGWSLLAPQQRWIIYPDGTFLSLPMESANRYTAIALFVLMSTVIGVVLAVAAWQIRFARGSLMILALVIGSALGSLIALLLGESLIGGVVPAILAQTPPATPTMVSMIPGLSWVSLIVTPLAALVPYTLFAAWHADPDLSRPQGPETPPAGIDPAGGDPAVVDQAGEDSVTAPIPVVIGGSAGRSVTVDPAAGTPRTGP